MEENQLTYKQAVTELEEIVKKMHDPECSIDDLSALTKRSKELLELCRARLTATDEELQKILTDLEPA